MGRPSGWSFGWSPGAGTAVLLAFSVALFCVAALRAALLVSPPGVLATAEAFAVVFVSIAVGALPFVLAGALVSGLLASFAQRRVAQAARRLPVGAQVLLALASGVAFPVCECGSVPVARRLAMLGLHPSAHTDS